LLGGKDDKGQPVYFETIEDWKVTKAQVADLKAAYFHHPKPKVTQITVLPDSKIKFKNQLADDKLPVVSWRAFGDDADLPLAKTGIAISSPQLILREGLRVVEITIMFLDSVELIVSPLKSDDFVLELSTKKKWETLAFDETLYDEDGESKDDKKTDKIGAFDLFAIEDEDHSRKTKGLKLLLVLEKDFEPVEQLEEANVLSDGTALKWPSLKIFFPPAWCEHHIQFGEITITVEVSDIRENLIIQTDQGVFDGTQTILPFGPVPEIGNQFYIGSTEVFQKALVELGLEFGWIGAPDLYSNHYNYYLSVLPVPKLKVDFIDAASVVPAKFADIGGGASQLLPKSLRVIAAGNNAISFNLTDMRGVGITGEVELTVGAVTAIQNPENGLYEIGVPGSSDFIANIISSDENYIFKDIPLKYLDYPSFISPEYDVILKPERIKLKGIAITDKVDCFFRVSRLDNADVTNIEIAIDGVVQRSIKFIEDRYQVTVSNIPRAIKIELQGCDSLDFVNEKGFTDFEVVLRPTGLEPNRNVEVSDKSNPTASPKLLVEDILTQQPVSGVAVSILGQNYLTNESGEIDLSGIDFEAETSISANHLLFNPFDGLIPENSTDKNLTIKIEPQPVIYRAVCSVTDNFFVTVPNVSIEIKDGASVLLTIDKISADEPEFNLLFSGDLLNRNPILRFIQADNAYLEFSSSFGDLLLNKPSPAAKKYLISEFVVRLDEANSNEFDLIVANKIKRVFPIEIRASNLARDIRTQHFEKYSPTLKRGFIRFTLFKNDFLHKQYPKLLAIPGYARYIEAPYTPSVNFISLSYKSVQTIVAPQDGVDGFYHLLPFDGYKKINLTRPKEEEDTLFRLPLLPSLLPEPAATHFHHNIGNLYIGLETLVPGDNLSLLIQLEEGSEVNQEALPPVVNWYYLSDNEWKAFGVEKILSDTTQGLMRSGVLQLAIPIDATKNNTLLNPDFHWISAKTVENEDGSESVGAFAAIKSIRAQAVKARYQIREGADLSRLARTLPPQSISKLAFARSEVKKIEQPYASFDGKLPEAHSSEYYRRISERLRHKDRAITAWDYENLLMEQYPYIAVAKCISHTRYETAGEFEGQSEWAPGFVSLAVIPDVLKRPSIVREKPRFSRGELSGMQQFLLPKTNVFQQTVAPTDATNATDAPDHYLQVVNPQYEELELILTVVLTHGTDENYAKLKINETLMNFIAPWRSGSTVSPTFGRSIARAKIIQVLEEMKEVDVIEKLEILHLVGDEFPSNPKLTLANKIAAAWKPFIATGPNIHPGSARSVLTSAASHTVFISYRPTRTREEEPPEIPVVQPPAESKTVVPDEASRGLIPEGKKVTTAARTTKTKTAKRKK
ncbi:MAG: hypothetical protein HUU01_06155, partial [Saprospiraceae bacterium]|nr:hypothetical protein [Saprospiraceae bacterium]